MTFTERTWIPTGGSKQDDKGEAGKRPRAPLPVRDARLALRSGLMEYSLPPPADFDRHLARFDSRICSLQELSQDLGLANR